MEGERTTREAIEAFMQSELAEEVVRRGSEITFAQQVDTWIRTLNFDEWEAYPGYLQEELSNFLADEINAGRLREMGGTPERGDGHPTAVEQERFDTVWSVIYNMALEGFAAQQVERYQDRPMHEAIEMFLMSGAGLDVVRLGSEASMRGELEAFMKGLNLDRWEGNSDYLDEALGEFVEQVTDAGYLETPGPDDIGLWEELRGVVEVGLDARYALEVARGDREDMRTPVEEAREDREVSAPYSLTERVQAFVQAVKDFVRGREMETPERGDEHGR